MSLKLRAGNPNDANRDYVPEEIKGTDMVVNENGNNSQVYPDLQEFTGVMADGLTDTWFEYVPKSYDGSKPVPLVISNHGGLMTGWAQAVYSSWTMLADREGFICIFPNAHEYRMWNVMGMKEKVKLIEDPLPLPVEPDDYHDNHDLNFVKALIPYAKEKYNIDGSRIFMQGMSMGHMMTDQFSRFYGDLLTAQAGSGASAVGTELYDDEGKLINYGGPLDTWISHPETNGMDGSADHEFEAQKGGIDYWMKVNGVHSLPRFSIAGEDNFAFYDGDKADLVFLDIKNRDHGQTLDEAFLYWHYMFKNVYRDENGNIVHTGEKPEADKFQIAFTDGSKRALLNGEVVDLSTPAMKWQKLKYHGLNGGQLVRGEYICAPVSFLAKAFGAEYMPSEDTLTCEIVLPDGRHVQFARGIIGALIDEELRCMYCEALHRNGELLVSVEWFARVLMGMTATECAGTVYITDHHAELSGCMAKLIEGVLTEE